MNFETIKARFADRRTQAAAHAVEQAAIRFDLDIDIQLWGEATNRAIEKQWRSTAFSWQEILDDHRNHTCWKFAIWAEDGERLAALCACKVRKNFVEFSAMEGDPRSDCPLKPQRFSIALDAVVRYASSCGLKEIQCEPLNEKLANHYISVYGFERTKPDSWKRLTLKLP